MPDRITPSARPSQASARLASIGSTEGRQPLGCGSVLIRVTRPAAVRRTTIWPWPGAITIRPGVSIRPSSAISAGRAQAASIWRAKTGMKLAGRCWVISSGTSKSGWSRRSIRPSAWMPPVDAPIATTSGRRIRRESAGGTKEGGALAAGAVRGAGCVVSPASLAPSARILPSRAARYSSVKPPGRGLSSVSAAPICKADSVCSAPSTVSEETTRTCGLPGVARISGSAPRPPIPGISRSSSTTSAGVRASCDRAPSALDAVPVITSAGSLSTIRLKIVRTVSESSTIITRIAAAAPAWAKGRSGLLPALLRGGGGAGFTQTRQAAA